MKPFFSQLITDANRNKPIDLTDLQTALGPTDTLTLEFEPVDRSQPITLDNLEVEFCTHPSK